MWYIYFPLTIQEIQEFLENEVPEHELASEGMGPISIKHSILYTPMVKSGILNPDAVVHTHYKVVYNDQLAAFIIEVPSMDSEYRYIFLADISIPEFQDLHEYFDVIGIPL